MDTLSKWPVDEPTLHFSVDDVRAICKSLKDGNKSSIFEDSLMQLLQQWHKEYGIVVSLYVQGDFTINTKYAKELISNADWLRWGYHGIGSNRRKKGMDLFHRQIMDSVGTAKITDHTTRIDYYHADLNTCKRLRKLGYVSLYTADDWKHNSKKRGTNYYLTDEQSDSIETLDIIQDSENDIIFVKTDIRIEYIEKLYGSVQNALIQNISPHRQQSRQTPDLMVVFTHEKYLSRYKSTTDSLFKIALDDGYSFGFPY